MSSVCYLVRFVSTVTHSITETTNIRHLDYVVFKEGSGDHYSCICSGGMDEDPNKTLKVVEAEVRDFIEDEAHWDAETMSAHILIYEVLDLRLSVRNAADVWQPKNQEHYETSQNLESLQLTAEILSSDFSRCAINQKLSVVPQVLLVILSALIWVRTQRGLLTQL